MLRFKRFLIAATATLALSPVGAMAYNTGENDALLEESQAKALPPAALAYYRQAEKAFDHIDRDAGVRFLEQAGKEAQDSMPLQFVVALRARQRARFYYGSKALEFYDIAEEAVQRILKQPVIKSEEKRRAEELLKVIQSERENLAANDKKKADVGFQAVVKPLAMERAKARGLSPSLETEAKAAKRGEASTATGATRSTSSTSTGSSSSSETRTGFSPTNTSTTTGGSTAAPTTSGQNPFGGANTTQANVPGGAK